MWIKIDENILGMRASELKRADDIVMAMHECKRRISKHERNANADMMDVYQDIMRKLQRRMMDAINAKGQLAIEYVSRKPSCVQSVGRKRRGMEVDGLYWEPYFRMWLPKEAFDVVSPIGELKQEWNNSSLKAGKEAGCVESIRKLWMKNGIAYDMCAKRGLVHLMDQLVVSYSAK